ncbi:MAG: hypothetical protein AAF447_08605 [Myxococcota bacterium]
MRAVFVVLVACSSAEAPDLRVMTPRTTLATLFEAWGIEGLSGAEVKARQESGRRFHLSDPQAFRACFADWERREDEALAGYVFGVLAPAKGSLRVVPGEERTLVFAPDASPIVLRPGHGWRIVLQESVPASVRRRLVVEARRLAPAHE